MGICLFKIAFRLIAEKSVKEYLAGLFIQFVNQNIYEILSNNSCMSQIFMTSLVFTFPTVCTHSNLNVFFYKFNLN